MQNAANLKPEEINEVRDLNRNTVLKAKKPFDIPAKGSDVAIRQGIADEYVTWITR